MQENLKKMQENNRLAQIVLDKIWAELKERHHYITNWMPDRLILSTCVVGIESSATIDPTTESITTDLICDRLLEAHNKMIAEASKSIKKLYQIKEKANESDTP